MPRNWSGMEGVQWTKKCIYRLIQSYNKKAFSNQPGLGCGACGIMPLENKATYMVWIYKNKKEF